ncbi:hypothetical protein SLEP1_g26291 [Rubroshorea leprosula]|uniref:Uncharacterized protein n=1 Tax=Rubroshorea leprosula TaxID=152421 RepID=A0AAV5JL76_9ROSI|nr:hypothetical protein SLEP1_g26291 [Rubroshorea leprosula]
MASEPFDQPSIPPFSSPIPSRIHSPGQMRSMLASKHQNWKGESWIC